VSQLRPLGHAHGWHDHAGHQIASDRLVSGFYLISQAKTGISSLELSRHLGVNYDTARLLHNKILRAIADREEAYLGGELPSGKAGRGSENKIPIVAAVSLNEAGHPIHARITAVSGFTSEAIGA
jgi:hypothetical protein